MEFNVESNWGYWDRCGDRRLRHGDLVEIKNLKTGKEVLARVRVVKSSYSYDDHGNTYQAPNEFAVVQLNHCPACDRTDSVKLRDLQKENRIVLAPAELSDHLPLPDLGQRWKGILDKIDDIR